MSKFEPEDKFHLYKVFQPEEHEFRVMYSVGNKVNHVWKKDRNGKPEQVPEWSVYSVYIKRDAIINRLNGRFFGEWASGFIDNQNPCIYHKDHVDCSMHMTIRDIRMEYNGSMAGTGENGAKGAATDAFKRVASQWGIGLYLQHAPTIMTKNPDTLDKQAQKQADKEAATKVREWVNNLLSGNVSKTDTTNRDVSPVPSGNGNGNSQTPPATKKPKEASIHPNHENNRRVKVLAGVTAFTDMNELMPWANKNGVNWDNSSADIITYINDKKKAGN